MAKIEFERKKPHVNVGILMQIERWGFSTAGARQIAHGEVVTDAADRVQLATLLTGLAEAASKRDVKYYSIVLHN